MARVAETVAAKGKCAVKLRAPRLQNMGGQQNVDVEPGLLSADQQSR
jgi:hypothetical protein